MKSINTMSEAPRDGVALVVISTDWCRYCASTHAAIDDVMPEHPDIALVRIDGDDEPDALSEVGAKTYPQLVLLRDGVKIAQRESADAATLRAWIAEHTA